MEGSTRPEVLLAPDSFKGTFSSREVAEALSEGFAVSGHQASVCPVADGGEGTLEALVTALRLEIRTLTVSDPLGRPTVAQFGFGGDGIAVIEMAAASGLGLVSPDQRDPIAASTRGTGELIAAAIAGGASSVYVAVGGSATTDGGTGAVQAIREHGGVNGAQLTVLCDVTTPFEQAARVFGPQKGATPEQVQELSERLARQAASFDRDPRGVPMTGAAGGLAGGLWAQYGAILAPGAAFVLDAIDFDARLRAVRAVVTGEGRLDSQSLVGKLISEVARRAADVGVSCQAVVGSNALDDSEAHTFGLQQIIEAGTREQFVAAGAQLGALLD